MSDPTTPATPAGEPAKTTPTTAPPALDTEAIIKAAEQAATEAVSKALAPLTEQVRSLEQKLAEAPTADAVSKAVTDAISAQQQQQAQQSARQKYIAEHLKDVPDAYHSHLGDDPAKWPEEEQHLRKVLRGDLEKLGVKADNIGGTAPPTGANAGGNPKPATAAVDTSKLSGIELLEMGVRQSGGRMTQPKDTPAEPKDTTPAEPADAA